MTWRRTRQFAGLVMLVCVATGSATAGATTLSKKLSTVFPRVGIGPIRLNETQRAVKRSVGNGRLLRDGTYAGFYRYRSGTITIYVSYDTTRRVDAMNTTSRSAWIYGRPLRQGLAKLRPVFRAHGWQTVTCGGETFTMLGQGGPGSGIAWRAGRLDDVQIDAGGSIGDQCLPD